MDNFPPISNSLNEGASLREAQKRDKRHNHFLFHTIIMFCKYIAEEDNDWNHIEDQEKHAKGELWHEVDVTLGARLRHSCYKDTKQKDYCLRYAYERGNLQVALIIDFVL